MICLSELIEKLRLKSCGKAVAERLRLFYVLNRFKKFFQKFLKLNFLSFCFWIGKKFFQKIFFWIFKKMLTYTAFYFFINCFYCKICKLAYVNLHKYISLTSREKEEKENYDTS